MSDSIFKKASYFFRDASRDPMADKKLSHELKLTPEEFRAFTSLFHICLIGVEMQGKELPENQMMSAPQGNNFYMKSGKYEVHLAYDSSTNTAHITANIPLPHNLLRSHINQAYVYLMDNVYDTKVNEHGEFILYKAAPFSRLAAAQSYSVLAVDLCLLHGIDPGVLSTSLENDTPMILIPPKVLEQLKAAESIPGNKPKIR